MKKVTFLLVSAILFASCEVYRPALSNIPILEQKGDVEIEAGLNFPVSADLSAAYAITDHIAVQAYGEYDLADADKVGLASGRLALGYYTPWSGHMYVGVYAGGSLGVTNQQNHFEDYELYTHSDFHTLFVQADWGIRPVSWFDFAVRLAVGNMGYSPSQAKVYHDTDQRVSSEGDPFSGWMWEPSVRLGFGSRNFKFNIKGGLSIIPQCNDFHEPYMIGFGISYRM